MAPTRRARSHAATPPPSPYATKAAGWLSRCRRLSSTRSRRRNGGRRAAAGAGGDENPLSMLPDDLVFDSIFSRAFSDAADVARCAATCRRWGRILGARGADAICRYLPPPPARLLPHLALGFFHGGTDDDGNKSMRGRLAAAAASPPKPWFVPMASATLLVGESSPFPGLGSRLFHHARPVASRNGLLVLELCSGAARRAGDIALAVCNPMTGDVALLPPLAGPGHDYACALLTAQDLQLDEDEDAPRRRCRPGRLLFSLVLVYNRRGFTAVRCYSTAASSEDGGGSWGSEARKPGAKLKGHVLRRLGQATVHAGVAYWLMHLGVLGVRLELDAAVADVCVVPYKVLGFQPGYHLLGTTLDGRLSVVSVSLYNKDMFSFHVETCLDMRSIDYDDHMNMNMWRANNSHRWDMSECIHMPELKVSATTQFKLRWLCEKSWTLFFTIGEGASTSGAFAFNLVTRAFQKLADGVECNSWTNFCGYEMDNAALVASVTARFT